MDALQSVLVPIHREGYRFVAAFAVGTLVLFSSSSPLSLSLPCHCQNLRRQAAMYLFPSRRHRHPRMRKGHRRLQPLQAHVWRALRGVASDAQCLWPGCSVELFGSWAARAG